MGYVRLQTDPFSVDAVLAELRAPTTGGVTAYVGTVRAEDDGEPIVHLEYEAFGEMARATLEGLRAETMRRFGLVDAIVIHRLGRLRAGEPILLVALAGVHRKETFAAVDFFMDRLKTDIPIWKRETTPERTRWILGTENRRVDA